MSCAARILDQEYIIPGLTETCHSTKECGDKANKKIVVDSETSLYICNPCMRRYLTKKTADSSWYGWFDCEYPADARILHSPWFRDAVKRGRAAMDDGEALVQQMATLTIEEPKEMSLLQQIAHINSWIKGEGKNNHKEMVVKQRELIELKTRLKMSLKAVK